MTVPSLLYQVSKEDESYLPLLKSVFAPTGCSLRLNSSIPNTVTEVIIRAKEKNCSSILCGSPKLLQLLLGQVGAKLPSLDDYAGSIIEKRGMEFLIVPPIKQLVTIPYGKFLLSRYLSKFLAPEKWLTLPPFSWFLFSPEKLDEIFENFSAALFCAVDIETGHEDERVITCISFTTVSLRPFYAQTVVIPFTDEYNLTVIRELLAFPVAKVFQNGKYDNAYLLRFNCPTFDYLGDTINLFHAWLSELPKDLAFISSFTLRKWQYWKDEAKTSNLMEYYGYNAKDSFATAMSWLSLLLEVPSYAISNYLAEFPLVFPCLLAEMTGLKRDQAAMAVEEEKLSLSLAVQLSSLQKMTATPSFNPGSPLQSSKLLVALGCEDIAAKSGTGKVPMDKAADRHPLNALLCKAITKYREDRKMVGTYLRENDPKGRAKSWHGRMFFSLNPHGTDTGRLSSRESAFWCGWQIQNLPRDRPDIEVKNGIVADRGFFFGEGDYRQNETWGTAFLSGDTALISTITDSSLDFHGTNASKFFGVPYSSVVLSSFNEELQEWVHKTVNKVLRNDIGKRVNHGANYNMGPGVMLDTMGIGNVRRAKQLLGLPQGWTLITVCSYLLEQFDKTYPVVRGAAYEKYIGDVVSSGYLVGPTGWTRRCFGNPKTNKHYLNAYVAHPPQSLAAMQLNIAYLHVFVEVALRYPQDFKLSAQIHDSILFQYRKGRVDLAWKVAECMRVPLTVEDVFGKKRLLEVPVDMKGEAERWSKVEPLRRKVATVPAQSSERKVEEELT